MRRGGGAPCAITQSTPVRSGQRAGPSRWAPLVPRDFNSATGEMRLVSNTMIYTIGPLREHGTQLRMRPHTVRVSRSCR